MEVWEGSPPIFQIFIAVLVEWWMTWVTCHVQPKAGPLPKGDRVYMPRREVDGE